MPSASRRCLPGSTPSPQPAEPACPARVLAGARQVLDPGVRFLVWFTQESGTSTFAKADESHGAEGVLSGGSGKQIPIGHHLLHLPVCVRPQTHAAQGRRTLRQRCGERTGRSTTGSTQQEESHHAHGTCIPDQCPHPAGRSRLSVFPGRGVGRDRSRPGPLSGSSSGRTPRVISTFSLNALFPEIAPGTACRVFSYFDRRLLGTFDNRVRVSFSRLRTTGISDHCPRMPTAIAWNRSSSRSFPCGSTGIRMVKRPCSCTGTKDVVTGLVPK